MSSDDLAHRARRAVLVRRIRWQARQVGATVDVDIALDARIGRRIGIEIASGTDNLLHLGLGSQLRDGVKIRLADGRIRIGRWCDIRDGVYLNVGGDLTVEDRCILSWGTVVHCNGRTHLAEMVGASDHVAIVDSTHYHSAPDVPFHDNVRTGTIEIGRNTWLGTKATVLRDTRIGQHCIVGANAVVSGEVPDGHAAVGNPAELRQRSLPWEHGDGEAAP